MAVNILDEQMAYLKTVITYNRPSEAEVDKAFLESNGLTVCLLNANTSRNELGAPFFIRLQVADEEYQQAVDLLRETNPSRFGSQARANELDRDFKRSVGIFVLGAIPIAILFLLITPAPVHRHDLPIYARQAPDLRPIVTVVAGILGGILATIFGRKKPLASSADFIEQAS